MRRQGQVLSGQPRGARAVVFVAATATVVAALVAHAVSAQAQSATPTRIPLRDFFRNPERTAFQVSEDGKTISFLAPYERRLNLFVQARGTTEARRITSITDRSIANYMWKGSDQLLFSKDTGGDENFHLFTVSKEGGEVKDLTPFEKVRSGFVDRLWDDPDHILISMNKRDPKVFDLYRIHVITGRLELVAENPGDVTHWVTDYAGRVRAVVATDGVNRTLLYRETETNSFQKILTTDFRERLDPQFFTFDNAYLIAASNRGRDKIEIVKLDPHSGQELSVIARRPDVDMDGASYSRQRKVLTEAHYTTWKEEREFLDGETAAMYRRIKAKLPGYEIASLDNHDRAEQTFIVHAYNDRTRGADYLYDKRSGELTKLADRTPWLHESDMAEMRPITYRSRDGLTIHGYLTLPRGVKRRNLPVVVVPHGGPWYRDDWSFDPEVQFLANRGYAVLQMNFRGSTGYGKNFWETSFKQWGRKMQDDITDGVHWLVRKGIANPKRIAIYGGSYGGYAALAGVTFTPDLYACGIDYVGVANMFTFLKTIPPYWEPFRQMWYEMVGDPVKDKQLLEDVSPVFHVDRVKVPMLIAQGANDPRVNKNESDQMVEALRKHGIPVEYIVKDNEGHGFRNEENRFEFYEAMEEFLAEHLNNN
ncbi:MAG TPA: S9 family peptidase [Verrucomicrobiae bacterium]|nr:S9 family peptidase [Verrucomicrobiae bacterium]